MSGTATPRERPGRAALHRFRICGKELRYTMEPVAHAFPAAFCDQLYPVVEILQDKLGEINDLATAKTHLRRRIKEAGNTDAVNHLQKLLAEEQVRLERAQRDFLDWYTPRLRHDLRAGLESMLAKVAASPCGPHPMKRQVEKNSSGSGKATRTVV